MKFDGVYCFSEVVIILPGLNNNVFRMDGAEVFVVTTAKGTDNRCGVLKVRDIYTIEGQTYKIPCDLKC